MGHHDTAFREEDLDEETVDREIRTGEAPWNHEHHDARDRQFASHIDLYGDDMRGQFHRSRDDGELGCRGHTELQDHVERGVTWPEDVRVYVAADHPDSTR
jgi:hypothetical protein